MSDQPRHVPVLVDQTLAVLSPRPGEVFLDCTAGLGGHAAAVASRLGPSGVIVLNDVDPSNLAAAAARVQGSSASGQSVVAIRGNFADAPRQLAERGMTANMVLADLGFSSNQVQDPGRGLSFSRDGPLDMRMDPTLTVTAAELVASLPEQEIVSLLREFGEERDATRIARRIVESRRSEPISTTARLAEIVRGPRPVRTDQIDPATRTFQALRIAVNDELGSLNSLLAAVVRSAEHVHAGSRTWLAPGARVAVISFHSLEDRAVKHAFRGLATRGLGKDLTRRPHEATEAERATNPRSRSAKLRAIRLSALADHTGPDPTSGDA